MSKKSQRRTPPTPPATVVPGADIRAEAIRAKGVADAKKAAADAVAVEAERLRLAHEVTAAEHERLRKEHAEQEAEAERLAAEAEARAAAEHAAKPWHQRLMGR